MKRSIEKITDKPKKFWYKRWWAIVLYVLVGLWILGSLMPEEKIVYTSEKNESSSKEVLSSNIPQNSAEVKPKVETIKKPTCTDECSQSTCDESYYINCLIGADGCKDKQPKEKIKGKCGVECLSNSDCSNDKTCTSNKCNKKSDILNSLEETKKVIENYQDKTNKLNECTKLCAGDSYDIPAYRNEWYNTCYQLYYYTGMEGLDEQIADCKE